MGCDTVRARFYHSEVATSEIALSADRDGSPTAALLHGIISENSIINCWEEYIKATISLREEALLLS